MKFSILKSGVGIRDDIRKLLKYMVVDEVNGIVDITHVLSSPLTQRCRSLDGSQGPTNQSPVHDGEVPPCDAEQGCVISLSFPVDPAIRCGNWDAKELSDDQIHYAACDSYYSRAVFLYFYRMYAEKEKSPLSVLEWSLVNDIEVWFPSPLHSRRP